MSNNKKTALVPRLRFPEFVSSEEWQAYTLDKIADRLTEKVGDKQLTTLSISAGVGFVSQAEKFSRDISGKQYNNYIFMQKGDFSYNKGNSKKFPQGCIYELKEYDEAAVPNAFISFRFNKCYVSDFYKGYFENNFHGKQLMKFITSGARMDGLLNINPSDFFSIILPTPKDKAEQQKIADCLSSLDDLIAAEDKKLESLNAHKKGLMQKLFPAEGKTLPEWRFPIFRGSGEWEGKALIDICNMQAGNYISAAEIDENLASDTFPCYGGNGLRGYTKTFTHTGKYPLIGRQGALCGNVTLVEGTFHATEHAVVCTPSQRVVVEWLYYQLVMMNLNQYATGQAQPGLSVKVLEKLQVKVPATTTEQQHIADCLSSVDDLITEQSRKIETLRSHKKGLMQGLFPSIEEVDE
jgi:type I restriction enzyme S subunit